MNRQCDYPCNVCGCAVRMPKNVKVKGVRAEGSPLIVGRKKVDVWTWVWTPKSSGSQVQVQCKECRDLIAGRIDWWQLID